MPLALAPKEEILEKVAEKDWSYFAEDTSEFFIGDRIETPEYDSPEYESWSKRMYPDDGSEPVLTPEEKAEEEVEKSVETVSRFNEGDGRGRYMTLHFKPYDLYVTLEGRYSSWGDSEWSDVYVSEPKEHIVISYDRKETK